MFDLKKNKLKDWLYFIKLERDIYVKDLFFFFD